MVLHVFGWKFYFFWWYCTFSDKNFHFSIVIAHSRQKFPFSIGCVAYSVRRIHWIYQAFSIFLIFHEKIWVHVPNLINFDVFRCFCHGNSASSDEWYRKNRKKNPQPLHFEWKNKKIKSNAHNTHFRCYSGHEHFHFCLQSKVARVKPTYPAHTYTQLCSMWIRMYLSIQQWNWIGYKYILFEIREMREQIIAWTICSKLKNRRSHAAFTAHIDTTGREKTPHWGQKMLRGRRIQHKLLLTVVFVGAKNCSLLQKKKIDSYLGWSVVINIGK